MIPDEVKRNLIEALEHSPIVQIACQKAGISRATFYRWQKNNRKFRRKVKESLIHGRNFINDLAESQIISQTKKGNVAASKYWLGHNHPNYMNHPDRIVVKEKEKTLGLAEMLKESIERRRQEKERNNSSPQGSPPTFL